jgi:glutaminyl-tRNA synthetase
VREDLNRHALRVMAVLKPLRVVLTNYPDDLVEEMEAVNNPEDATAGTRKVPFSKVLYIERDDFREDPPKEFYRLSPGREVRLRYGYIIKCERVIKDPAGNIIELHCSYDPETRSGSAVSTRKVKATIHWVSAAHAVAAEVRLYDTLFMKENPEDVEEGKDFTANLNPNSLEVLTGCKVEPALRSAVPGTRYQFERLGYFYVDPDSTPETRVFNRTIGLRDTWAKIEQRTKSQK